VVTLSSSNTAVATVPSSVTVAANSSTATFTVTAKTVAATSAVTITGTYNSTSKQAALTVTPPALTLTGLALSPSSVVGGNTSTATVTLSGAAPTGGAVVTLSSSNTAVATVPSSVTVAANSSTATFTVTTSTVTGTSAVTITGTYNSASKQAALTVTPPGTTPTGLVAAYAFNEGSGTTTVDASGNGQNGTITAGTWTTSGKNGNALSFNGSSSWVTVPDSNSLDLSTGMTLEAWVYPTVAPTNWNSIIMKEAPGFYVYALYISPSSHPSLAIVINGIEQGFESSTTMPLNTWSHLAGTYDGTTLRLYVNGTQIGTQAISAVIPASTGVLRIGGNSIWTNEFFKGRIDDVRIYSRSLTAGEIQTDMSNAVK
jgi:hypothetical protein